MSFIASEEFLISRGSKRHFVVEDAAFMGVSLVGSSGIQLRGDSLFCYRAGLRS